MTAAHAGPQPAGAAPGGLVIVTDVDFWRGGAGHRARIAALARYLCARLPLTIVFLGPMRVEDMALVDALGVGGRMLALRPRQADPPALREALARALHAIRPRAVLFEYLRLHALLPAVPAGIARMVDLHDLVSERDAAFAAAGIPLGRPALAEREELELIARFDLALAIAPPDRERLAATLGAERVLYVPHAVDARALRPRSKASTVGFVGSRYPPNVLGMQWLLAEVWPRLAERDLRLRVFGTVCERLAPAPPGVELCGFVPDLRRVYRAIDIAVNPVRYGAGLKIKTVEALAHGLPLVTTTHGARGLEDGAGRAFVVADTPQEFAAAAARLAADSRARRALSRAGAQYAAARFTPDAAYGALARLLLPEEASP